MDLMDLYFDHPVVFWSGVALLVLFYVAIDVYKAQQRTRVDVQAKAEPNLTVLGPRRYETKTGNWRCQVDAESKRSGGEGSIIYWALSVTDPRLDDLAEVRIEKAGLLQRLPNAETFLEIDVVTTGDKKFDEVYRIIHETSPGNDADVVRFCVPSVLRAVEKMFEQPKCHFLRLSPGSLDADLGVNWNVEKGVIGAKAHLELAAALDEALRQASSVEKSLSVPSSSPSREPVT